VSVGGMTCGACTSAVEGGFKGVDGLVSFSVSLITERAVAVHDPKVLSAEKVVEM
jgi:Cu+-exporting ATPase